MNNLKSLAQKLSFFVILISSISIVIVRDFKVNAAVPNSLEEALDENSDFDHMMSVVMHPRCMNCHPSGDRPSQGEDSHEHYFEVQRGEDGRGAIANRCQACHGIENNDISGVPGAPQWHLAPLSMGWQGLTKKEIAQSMRDPVKNGGRSLEAIRKHMTEDALVLWAFNPGVDAEGTLREAPPISKQEFIDAVNSWAEAGGGVEE